MASVFISCLCACMQGSFHIDKIEESRKNGVHANRSMYRKRFRLHMYRSFLLFILVSGTETRIAEVHIHKILEKERAADIEQMRQAFQAA